MSFVFYDTETTGIETAFDQILQFGAIRTDANLQETERFEVRCRLQDRVIASPHALRVTGVSVAQLTNAALPSHYEMMRQIRDRMMSWSPAVFIGYNSLNFDEHLLRSALWKTLHPPYLTNTSRNSRADAMRVVQAVAALRPGLVAVPTGPKGKPSFKLDAIAPANGFDHVNAHDALADVEATIFLCRVIAEKAPDLWSTFMRFAQKAAVVDFTSGEEVFGLIELFFGKTAAFVVTVIGQNSENSAELYALDLTTDPDELSSLSDDDLRKRLGETPKIVRRIKSNAAPLLLDFDDMPRDTSGSVVSSKELKRRARSVGRSGALAKRIVAVLEQTKKVKEISQYVEEQIYDGFTSNTDAVLLSEFHELSWEERPAVVERIQDVRLQTLARRLIYDERPDLLTASDRDALGLEIATRLLSKDETAAWCTLSRAIADCRTLIATGTPEEQKQLREYLEFCETRERDLLS